MQQCDSDHLPPLIALVVHRASAFPREPSLVLPRNIGNPSPTELPRRRGGYFATVRTESLHVQGDDPSGSCPPHASCLSLRLRVSARVGSCPFKECPNPFLSQRRGDAEGNTQVVLVSLTVLAPLCASAALRESALVLSRNARTPFYRRGAAKPGALLFEVVDTAGDAILHQRFAKIEEVPELAPR